MSVFLCVYHGTVVHYRQINWSLKMTKAKYIVERVQTGVRMEKRVLKVLKAFAEFHDMTLGDLLEGIVLHAFDGKVPFQAESLRRIRELKKFYGLRLDAKASHRMSERGAAGNAPTKAAPARAKARSRGRVRPSKAPR